MRADVSQMIYEKRTSNINDIPRENFQEWRPELSEIFFSPILDSCVYVELVGSGNDFFKVKNLYNVSSVGRRAKPIETCDMVLDYTKSVGGFKKLTSEKQDKVRKKMIMSQLESNCWEFDKKIEEHYK